MDKKRDIRLLLSRVSEGDQEAFKVLFNAYCNRVNAFATRLTRSPITGQESVQEVFMKIWLKRRTLRSVDNFDAYLFAIVRNHVYNILRRKALEEQVRTIFGNELVSSSASDEDDALQERTQLLHGVINALPRQQRRVFELCHRQGLKYQEAAALLNISQLTVKTHMQQALRTIRVQLTRAIISITCAVLFNFL